MIELYQNTEINDPSKWFKSAAEKMKILYIVQHFAGPSGSSGLRPYEFSRRLIEKGHKVTLLCGSFEHHNPEDDQEIIKLGVNLIRAPIRYGQKMNTIRRLISFASFMRWAIKKGKLLPCPDVVFASSTPLTVGEIGRKLALHHDVPFIFEVRDLWPEMPIEMGKLRNSVLHYMSISLARKIYLSSNHIVAISPDTAVGIQKWRVPIEKITVIPNGCDNCLFERTTSRSDIRKEKGWNGKFICIFPGAMGEANGVDYLLEVGRIFAREGIEYVRLVLMGEGSQKARYKDILKQENILTVELHDMVPKYNIPAVLHASDVGIGCLAPIPILSSGSPNKIFDFFAAGLPVLINYGGWQRKLLHESGAGLSADPNDPGTMVDNILFLKNNPKKRAAMGKAAKSLAEKQFDRSIHVQMLEKIFENQLSNYRKQHNARKKPTIF